MDIHGQRWKSADDMQVVLYRRSLASRFSFHKKGPSSDPTSSLPIAIRTQGATALLSNPPLNKDGVLSFTSMCLAFLHYREKELKHEWPLVESAFQEHGMSCKLNLDEGTLTVATTPKTRGADIINKARDLLVLLALLPVPPSAAVDILSGKRLYDIIWTCDSNGGLASQLPLPSRMRYFSRMRKLRRSIKDLMCLTGCPIFYNLGICVVVFGHQPRSLVLVRNVVSSCIFYNQDPATIIRLITLGRQRNAQSTVILEMDAYGFETAPGVDITFCIADYMSKAPVLEYQKLERVRKKYLFGPSVNKAGMFVCGSYFLKKRERDVVEAWPMLKSVSEEYGITCTMYQAEHFMTLSTTSLTKDPEFIIHKAKDALELLSLTCVPPSMVMKVLNGDLHFDIIKTGYFNGGFLSQHKIDKKLFSKRRRVLAPYLKELAQLSGCKIYADGWAITAMGGEHRGLKVIRKGVTRCLVDNWRPSSMIRYVKLSLDRRKMKVKGESSMNMVI